jgi:hypothetical protein
MGIIAIIIAAFILLLIIFLSPLSPFKGESSRETTINQQSIDKAKDAVDKIENLQHNQKQQIESLDK